MHPWIADTADKAGEDLLPVIKKNFNARRTLHAAIDTIRAINQLRAGGAAAMMMDGAMSKDPARAGMPANPREMDSRGNARGQTEDMIIEQERRIREAQIQMWNGH